MKESISVVIPVFNQSQLTRRCLESLLAHSLLLKEVWVVDNASKDETPELLRSFESRFKEKGIFFEILTQAKNVGFGRACNQGLRRMTGDFLVVLNNDTWLMPGWDRVLVKAAFLKKADCIGPYFYEKPFEDEQELFALSARFTQRNFNHFRTHFVPILMMFTRVAYDQLKINDKNFECLFDERFFVTYEDTDLKERMVRAGLSYLQTGSCFIWHHSRGTRTIPGALPPQYEEEGLRLFMDKWGFDPRTQDHTLIAKLKRRWWKIKEQFGCF